MYKGDIILSRNALNLNCSCKKLSVIPNIFSILHMDLSHMSLYFEWNSITLGGPAHGIVTKAVHKTLPRVVGYRYGV